MTCFWEPGSAQGMEEGGKETEITLQNPRRVLPASVLSWQHSPLHMAVLEVGGCAWET